MLFLWAMAVEAWLLFLSILDTLVGGTYVYEQ